MGLYASDLVNLDRGRDDVMKKLSTWMLVLMLAPAMVALTGCKKDEAAEGGEMAEPMAEATPAPMEPMVEATPMMEATPAMAATPSMEATPAPTASPAQ
jgi:hypothetical protein